MTALLFLHFHGKISPLGVELHLAFTDGRERRSLDHIPDADHQVIDDGLRFGAGPQHAADLQLRRNERLGRRRLRFDSLGNGQRRTGCTGSLGRLIVRLAGRHLNSEWIFQLGQEYAERGLIHLHRRAFLNAQRLPGTYEQPANEQKGYFHFFMRTQNTVISAVNGPAALALFLTPPVNDSIFKKYGERSTVRTKVRRSLNFEVLTLKRVRELSYNFVLFE